MSADDHTEPFVASETPREPVGTSDVDVALAQDATSWLIRRTANATSDVVVAVAVLPGRWIIRTEVGASSSAIEIPVRVERSPGDVAAAVRRWARAAGLVARVEAPQGGEARVTITPVSATRS